MKYVPSSKQQKDLMGLLSIIIQSFSKLIKNYFGKTVIIIIKAQSRIFFRRCDLTPFSFQFLINLFLPFYTFYYLFIPFYTFLHLNQQTQHTPNQKTNPKQSYQRSIFSTVVLPQQKLMTLY
jgi:hypothetical protein